MRALLQLIVFTTTLCGLTSGSFAQVYITQAELDELGDDETIVVGSETLLGPAPESSLDQLPFFAGERGLGNTLSATQRGNGNALDALVSGAGNRMLSQQLGDNMTSLLSVQGFDNDVLQRQSGSNHYSEINVDGSGHSIEHIQSGAGTSMILNRIGGNGAARPITIIQTTN